MRVLIAILLSTTLSFGQKVIVDQSEDVFKVVIAIGLVPLHRGLEDYIKSRWLKRAKELSN